MKVLQTLSCLVHTARPDTWRLTKSTFSHLLQPDTHSASSFHLLRRVHSAPVLPLGPPLTLPAPRPLRGPVGSLSSSGRGLVYDSLVHLTLPLSGSLRRSTPVKIFPVKVTYTHVFTLASAIPFFYLHTHLENLLNSPCRLSCPLNSFRHSKEPTPLLRCTCK